MRVQCPQCHRIMAEVVEGGAILIKGKGRQWKLSPRSSFDSVYCPDCKLWFVPVAVVEEAVGHGLLSSILPEENEDSEEQTT